MAIAQIASTCMACTLAEPLPIENTNESVIYFTGDTGVEIIPSREYMYGLVARSRPVTRPITKGDIFPRNPASYSYRVQHMNNNKKSRKHHNIRQPGGASDDQRRMQRIK